MLTLYGFAASNYYNKVKLALMEKGIAFEESLRWPDQTDGEVSPLHKVLVERAPQGLAKLNERVLRKLIERPVISDGGAAAGLSAKLVEVMDRYPIENLDEESQKKVREFAEGSE